MITIDILSFIIGILCGMFITFAVIGLAFVINGQ